MLSPKGENWCVFQVTLKDRRAGCPGHFMVIRGTKPWFTLSLKNYFWKAVLHKKQLMPSAQ